MSSTRVKNYYEILGVNPNASQAEIDEAYKKLSNQWHPDRNKENRKEAERKFQEINEAYETLSNQNKRANYDNVAHGQFTDQDADRTFERFFEEHGMVDENEKQFFDTHYPERKKNYYDILGVPRTASIDDIKSAYRKLALQYHPKNNTSPDARKKFNEINEAYNALSNEARKNDYDSWFFGEIAPLRAHNIFEDFWGNRWNELEDDSFFRPLLTNKWVRDIDRQLSFPDWNNNDWSNVKEGESQRSQTYYTNKNGVEHKKVVNSRTKVENGVPITETTEEYHFPDGTREVRKIKDDGKGNTTSNVYHLKKGENLPIEN